MIKDNRKILAPVGSLFLSGGYVHNDIFPEGEIVQFINYQHCLNDFQWGFDQVSNEMQYNNYSEYQQLCHMWLEERKSHPGTFSCSEEETMYLMCRSILLPDPTQLPILRLPLIIHLAVGDEFGCVITQQECVESLVPQINLFWRQASIQWDLVKVKLLQWNDDADGSRSSLHDARENINKLTRDKSTGMMTNKDVRKKTFLDNLIPKSKYDTSTFDVYIFDFIGHESQGCCISRESHTIILGNRSTKGYPEPTVRPLSCLAKTCAHELGHALGLGHPKGLRFSDGTPHTERFGSDNLMTGGVDSRGGGGNRLENWQIIFVRRYAEEFLGSLSV